MNRWYWGLLPLLAGLAAYAVAPWGDLVWDDQLVARQQMAAFGDLANVFLPPAGIPQWTYAYYRPVVVLSYLFDEAMFGRGAAAGPHVANVAYHLLTTFMVWRLARRLLHHLPTGGQGALLAALLFAVHPIHTESVSWVTGRSDVLATLLLLPSLLLGLRWRDSGSPPAMIGAALSLLLALLAKEVAIVAVVLLPALLWLAAPAAPAPAGPGANPKAPPARRAPWILWSGAVLGYLAAVMAYGLLRIAAGTTGSAPGPEPAGGFGLTAMRALAWYLGKLLWPWPQSNFVSLDMLPAPGVAVGILAAGLAVAVLSVGWTRTATARPAVLGLLWIAAALVPAIGVLVTGVAVTPVAERYLYLPSVGLAIWVGAQYCRLHGRIRGPVLAGACALVVLAATAATLARGTVWLSDLRLWADAVRKSGEHALPLIEYGKAQSQAGLEQGAEATFRRALAAADNPRLRATAQYNLGAMAAMRGQSRQAAELFAAAAAANPGYAMARYGLGRAWYDQGLMHARAGRAELAMELFDRAEAQQETALRLNPYHAGAHLELARISASRAELLAARGDPSGARAARRTALERLDRAADIEPAVAARPEVRALRTQVTGLLVGGAPR